MNNLPLNEFVKAKRKSLGLSREEFAQKAGVGIRFLRELEQGKPGVKTYGNATRSGTHGQTKTA